MYQFEVGASARPRRSDISQSGRRGSNMSSTSPLVPHYQKEIVTSMNSSPSQSVPVSKPPGLLGPDNTLYDCPFCNARIKTSVKYTSTALTYIAGALWCTACCLCCIPLCCSESTKNADHYCPSCHRYLGSYKRC